LRAHLEELRAGVAKERLLSTAPTQRLLGNPSHEGFRAQER